MGSAAVAYRGVGTRSRRYASRRSLPLSPVSTERPGWTRPSLLRGYTVDQIRARCLRGEEAPLEGAGPVLATQLAFEIRLAGQLCLPRQRYLWRR